MHDQRAFPLSWPPGWPRTKATHRMDAPFWATTQGDFNAVVGRRTSYRKPRSMAEAADGLILELERLAATGLVISSNAPLRKDGLPMSNRVTFGDPGAAAYFHLKGKPVSLACDKWLRVEDNLWAICKHVEAIRGQERWGVGSVEQAFRGYMALPPGGSSAGGSWWNILGCAHDAPAEVVRAAFRTAAAAAHPDRPSGSHERMVAVNAAWDQARQALGSSPA